jgi:hypothetical protein
MPEEAETCTRIAEIEEGSSDRAEESVVRMRHPSNKLSYDP